jgi:hypothetical protein
MSETTKAKTADKGKGAKEKRHHHNIIWVSTILKKQKSKAHEDLTVTAYADDARVWRHYIEWLHKEIRSDESSKEIQAKTFGILIDTLVKKDPEYAKHVAKLRKEKTKEERAKRKDAKTASAKTTGTAPTHGHTAATPKSH